MKNSELQQHTTLEQFKEFLSNMNDEGVQMRDDGEFSFGFNWLDFVKKRMEETIIGFHTESLQSLYNSIDIDLKNKSVFDIGCGSGLSSLSFARLGCAQITSMDIDRYSVEATEYTKNNFWKGNANWKVFRGSILEDLPLEKHSQDIVYSWGVLHHTGDMWNALRNSVQYVKSGGIFHVALYRSGCKFPKSLDEKYSFKFADKEKKIQMLYDRAGQKIFSVKKGRGMNKFHDALDWLGGLPYDVADPEVLFSWLKDRHGFDKVLHFTDANGGGNFTAVLQKS
jgi:2-polyprenyl-6-hydroxyphenyl methylase/3-demethylubiquinone-9 3-methyltransferase